MRLFSAWFALMFSLASAQESRLTRFAAGSADGFVELSWETQDETDLLGFIVLRALSDSATGYVELAGYTNDSALIARGAAGAYNRRYVWNDLNVSNGNRYWYKLKLVLRSGAESLSIAISASPSAERRMNRASLQLGWEWQSPVPPGNEYFDVCFIDQERGWIVGANNTLLRTRDGGHSWEQLKSGLLQNASASHTGIHFRQVRFFDQRHGVVGGYRVDQGFEDFVLHTRDGGDTWQATFRSFIAAGNAWLDMFFLDEHHGWLFVDGRGTFKTADGGLSWAQTGGVPPPIPSGGGFLTPSGLYQLCFTSPDTGWGAFESNKIFYTINSGKEWVPKTISALDRTYDIFFLEAKTGWLIDERGQVYHTKDAGATWNLQSSFNRFLSRIFFLDHNTGFALGNGAIFKTKDRGNTWTTQTFGRKIFLSGVSVNDSADMWIVGQAPWQSQFAFPNIVLHSRNQGESWERENHGVAAELVEVKFLDLLQGWALGTERDSVGIYHTVLLRTTNGGKIWERQVRFDAGWARAMTIIDREQNLVAAHFTRDGSSPPGLSVFSTRDGWRNAQRHDLPGYEFAEAQFLDLQSGWVCGANGLLLRTDDAGQSWQQGEIQTADRDTLMIDQIHFTDSNHGWAAAWNGATFPSYGVLLATKDAGRTWRQIWKATNVQLTDIVFTDSLHGWASAQGNQALRTFDGGRSWQAQQLAMPEGVSLRFRFRDPMLGWVLSDQGHMFLTADGGQLWQSLPRVTEGITMLDFVDAEHGWMVGGQSRILSTSSRGLMLDHLTQVAERVSEQETGFELDQNYPNPFNPATVIRYRLPRAGKVTLKIYNVLGQEVRRLVDGAFKAAGVHAARWDGKDDHGGTAAAGIYFYRLEGEGFVRQRKMIILH